MRGGAHSALYAYTHAQLARAVGRASPVPLPSRAATAERRPPRFLPRNYVTPEQLRADVQRRVGAAGPVVAVAPSEAEQAHYWNKD